ncbi:MAG: sialidase family protein [Candidatus Acidiferrales bacterium]
MKTDGIFLRWKVCLLLPLAFVAVATRLTAQSATMPRGVVHIGTSVNVSKALPVDPHYEVEIDANPGDANELVACSMLFANDSPTSEVVTYVSTDGGKSWQLALRTQGEDGYQSWDPDCRYGPGHILYSLSEGSGSGSPSDYDRVDRSLDAGKTWQPFTRAIHAERSFITVDQRPGPHQGWVYLYGMGDDSGSIRVGYSTDKGQTFFTQVVPMEPGTEDVNVGPGVMLSDGTLVIPMPVLTQPLKESQQSFRVQLPAQIRIVHVKFERPNWPLEVTTSTVAPWLADFEPNGSYYTTLAVDSSDGPFKNRIYATWEDRSSGRSQVKFVFSSDEGKSWSHPRVIDDDVAKQVGNTIKGPDDIHGVVAVNQEGIVGVTWLDRRDYDDNLGWALRFRASLDGGETFLPSEKISNADYEPSRGDRVPLFGGADSIRSTNDLSIGWFTFHGGHTMGLTADANGGFHPLWVANPTGTPQLWTTDVTVDGKAVKNGSPELSELSDASKLVHLEFLNRYYNLRTHSLDFDLRLRNKSKFTIEGPLKVRVLDVGSYVGDVTIRAGTIQSSVEGAVWDFTPLLPGREFRPGDVSKPMHLRLTVQGIDPFTQIGRFTFFLTPVAILTTKVLAGSIQQPSQESVGETR